MRPERGFPPAGVQSGKTRKPPELVSMTLESAHLTRETLEGHPATILKDDGPQVARVVRYDLPQGSVVLKEWKPAGLVMGWWARMSQRREIAHYRLLAGTPGIPRLLAVLGDCSFIVEYVPGEPLQRNFEPARMAATLDGLERVMAALHAKRFAHLDLHQKRNVLADADGAVWLVDLGQGVDCSRPPLRWLFPLLAHFDRNGLLKFRAKYAPETLDPERREEIVRRHGGRRSRPYANIPRRLLRRIFNRD